MSYLRKPPTSRYARRGSPPAMGDLASTITNLASGVGIAVDLANDPYLPEMICRVSQLRDINAGKKPPPCGNTAPGLAGGVGLRKVMPGVRAYVYSQEHKWVIPAAVAAVVGIPFLIGYALGRD